MSKNQCEICRQMLKSLKEVNNHIKKAQELFGGGVSKQNTSVESSSDEKEE